MHFAESLNGQTVNVYPACGFCQQDRIYFTHFRKKTGDQPKLYIWARLPRNVTDPQQIEEVE